MAAVPDVQTIDIDLFATDDGRIEKVERRGPATRNAVLAEEFAAAVADTCSPHSTGAGWIANVLSRLAVDSFAYEALRVHAYGDVALVQARYRQQGTLGGRPRDERFTVTDLWIRREDRWQVATRYVGRADPASP